jgi:hypothetical protein
MDSFRTTLDAQRASFQINHSDRMLLVGSCFTEHIGVRLLERKFRVAINPNGIVYNPVSMATCLKRLWIGNQPFEALELFEHMGLWHSWEHHSHFSKPEQTAALEAMNAAYDQAGSHLQGANRLLFTLGTADVFMLHENSRVVANNHKMPGSMFRQKKALRRRGDRCLEPNNRHNYRTKPWFSGYIKCQPGTPPAQWPGGKPAQQGCISIGL